MWLVVAGAEMDDIFLVSPWGVLSLSGPGVTASRIGLSCNSLPLFGISGIRRLRSMYVPGAKSARASPDLCNPKMLPDLSPKMIYESP